MPLNVYNSKKRKAKKLKEKKEQEEQTETTQVLHVTDETTYVYFVDRQSQTEASQRASLTDL